MGEKISERRTDDAMTEALDLLRPGSTPSLATRCPMLRRVLQRFVLSFLAGCLTITLKRCCN